MTQLEHLSSQDAAILALEEGNIVGHTAKVFTVEPRGKARLTTSQIRENIEARIDNAPRLRQRIEPVPFDLSTPAWVDDPKFNVARHVRKVTTRASVEDQTFREICGGLMGKRLDRERPLWQIDVVEGLTGGRTGIIWRLHHSMADGMSSLQLADSILWSSSKTVEDVAEHPQWKPASAPSRREIIADALATRARGLTESLVGHIGPLVNPTLAARRIRSSPEVPRIVLRELLPTGDESPLDASPSNRRVVAVASVPLDQVRAIEHAAGKDATVNDVVLAAVGGGLERWLRERDVVTHRLRIKVPANLTIHREHHAAEVGNHDSFILVDTSINGVDPRKRLADIVVETNERKHDDPRAIDTFISDLGLLPKPLRSFADRWLNSPRVFALNVSNVRGPSSERFVAGHLVSEFYSLVEIGERHALRVAVFSYNGVLSFGLCGDAEALADVDLIATGIKEELHALTQGFDL